MEEQEKKPLMGPEFLKKATEAVLNKASGTPAKASPEDEVGQIKKQTAKVQAQYDLSSTVEALTNPPALQEIRQKREAEIEASARRAEEDARRLHEENLARIQAERDAAVKHAAEEEERRKETDRAFQQQQTQMLLDKLQELKEGRKPFDQQLDEYLAYAERTAERMGFQKATAQAPGSDNPMIQLEITKMQLDSARQDREFQWKMKQDEREFEVKLMGLRQDQRFKEAEIERNAKRDDWLSTLPQSIGGAFAKGLRDQATGAPAAPQRMAGQPPGPEAYEVTMDPGEQGVVKCPNCQTDVGLGPDTEAAQCVGCSTQFRVVRQGVAPAQAPAQGQQGPQDYEEGK